MGHFIQQKSRIPVTIALFDLDNTLLKGDSDYEWGQFLVEHDIVDPIAYQQANERFYKQYVDGELDIFEFARFAFKPLKDHTMQQLEEWRRTFIREKIRPIMLDKGRARIAWHQQRGDTVIIITATNQFVTAPIAKDFGVSHLLATKPEIRSGQFTGEISGTPCFQQGKVIRLQAWLDKNSLHLNDSWCYSDSHNDLPLLEEVTNPHAVDPDDTLLGISRERNWNIMTFRD
jgi:HAD superfamily hydrolase (TIGR01490 family)